MAQKPASYFRATKKYDIPIYSGTWVNSPKSLNGDHNEGEESSVEISKLNIVVGGGGGDKKHGIKNRIVMAEYNFQTDELSEEVFHLSTEEDPPFALAVHPGGDYLVAAFEKGCRLYNLNLKDETKLVSSEKPFAVLEEAGEQKFVLFSPDGTRFAVGGEDKRLRVFEWPSLKVLLDVGAAHKQPLKDADFSLDGMLLATTADSGPCHVWDISSDTAVASLPIKEGRLGFCRFAKDGSPRLFTTIVKAGQGYVATWSTETWTQVRLKRFHNDPISAFAVSRDGKLLGMGTAEGDVSIVDAKKFYVKQSMKEAHMVFTTAVEFSPDCRALLSVSGDSSARVICIDKVEREGFNFFLLILIFIIAVVLGKYVRQIN